jgi:hypothetical protein
MGKSQYRPDKFPLIATIRAAQEQVFQEDDNVGLVDADSLTFWKGTDYNSPYSDVHFDSKSLIKLGNWFSTLMTYFVTR